LTAGSDQPDPASRTASLEPRVSSPALLTLLTLGPCEASHWRPLEERFRLERIEQPDADAHAAPEAHAPRINEAIDRAAAWLLILKDGERVSRELANELARLAIDPPAVSACRIVVSETWSGRRLWRRDRREGGEIRLLHARRGRFVKKEGLWTMRIRGTVVRAGGELTRVVWSSEEDHRGHLETAGVPRSAVRRMLVFAVGLWRWRRRLTTTAMRALWIDAGWDQTGYPVGSSVRGISGGSPDAPC
jgi:hypothetical protein